ncbi:MULTISPECIES: flagellar export chaperone FliS [Marinomonas]|uniref:Flagellar secretion chaperone FliS n=1 Tax=Marinomonas arctica TaxID=383750 RepID=A0A7H1J3P5_9GAMM|nr:MULTISPECIES: flagellar export chaperone FliS [Marinomonas]MCS7487011.1 flagellar protein FliS [Marinomonas sp. BSi20414]QNT05111.1 flagellar export chaperone FliS [Marinomonas arctica]GGN16056.1 B-type flagellar protein FliS [Marinomonas arctica]
MYGKKGIQAYKKDSIKSDLASADPHRVIQLLMQGALERLALGKGCIERADWAGKAAAFTRAIEIINALRDALDRDVNPELVDNLDGLYDYMIVRINEASVSKDCAVIDHVIALILQIKGAWDQISEADKQQAYSHGVQARSGVVNA